MILLVYLCIVDHEGGAGQDEPGPRGEVVEDARRGPGHGHEAGLSSSEADSAAEVEQLGVKTRYQQSRVISDLYHAGDPCSTIHCENVRS